MTGRTVPTFLVVGAARGRDHRARRGLRTNTQVFITEPKEPHYFALHGAAVDFQGPGDAATINRVAVPDKRRLPRALPEGRTTPCYGDGSVSTMYYHEHALPEMLRMNPAHAAGRAAARTGRPCPLELPVHAGARVRAARGLPRGGARRAAAQARQLAPPVALHEHEPVRRRGRGDGSTRSGAEQMRCCSTTTWSATTRGRCRRCCGSSVPRSRQARPRGAPRQHLRHAAGADAARPSGRSRGTRWCEGRSSG